MIIIIERKPRKNSWQRFLFKQKLMFGAYVVGATMGVVEWLTKD